jgi:RHS repeat-associated protein
MSGRRRLRPALLAGLSVTAALLQVVAGAVPAQADQPAPPTAVTLAASRTTVGSQQSSLLTATANGSVTGTGYYISIYDVTTGIQIPLCDEGTTCAVNVGFNYLGNAPHTFRAYVASSDPGLPPAGTQATSNDVVLTPQPWNVTLAASITTVGSQQTTTLTATANQSLDGVAGLGVSIYDVTTGNQLVRCTSGTTCAVSPGFNYVANGPHTFRAFVASSDTGMPPAGAKATSNDVTVTPQAWSVALTASRTVVGSQESSLVTATANQSLDGVADTVISVYDTASGIQLAMCDSGTTCAVSVSFAYLGNVTHTFRAHVARRDTGFPPAGIKATSNDLVVTPAPWSVTLTASHAWIDPGDSVTYTATANQSVTGTGLWVQVFDLTTGTLLCAESTGTTCSVAYTVSGPAHQIAGFVSGLAASPPPPNERARSNVIQAPTSYDTVANLGTPANTPTAGDPVNVATGNFVDQVTDVTTSQAGLGFARTYNSQDPRVGVLGRGWTGSYSASLTVDGLGNVVVRTDDARSLTFTPGVGGTFLAPAGFAGALAHNGDGTWTLSAARGGDVRFAATGALTRVGSADGRYVDLGYSVGRLTSATSSAGPSVAFGYDAGGRLSSVTSNDGRTVQFAYAGGRLASATAVDGGATAYTYDSRGRLATVVDGDGRTVVVNTYDDLDRVTSQVTAHGQRLDLAYSDDATRTTTVTEATTGAVTTYRFDAQARLLSATDPTGHTASRSYGATGYLDSATDRRANGVGYSVDADGNVTGRTLPSGTEGYTYDAANRLVTATDAAGHTTSFGYTGTERVPSLVTWPDLTTTAQTVSAGLVTATTDADGVTRTFGYDSGRNLIRVTDALAHDTTMTYDAAGRLHTRTTPADETTTWGYDAAGRVTSVTDPTGAVTSHTYDHAGNVTSTTDANGHTTSYTYDNASQLVRTDHPDGTQTSYTYDDHGNQLTETRAGGATTTYTYGPLGRLATATDPAGVTTTYGYDANGAVTTVTDAAGKVTTTIYDAAGEALSVTDPLNRTTTYVRDALERVTSTTDPAGAVTATTYDARGRVASVTDPLSHTTSYTYTPGGRLDHVTYPGGWARRYTYDAAGRRATERDLRSYDTVFAYDADGRLASTTTPEHLTTSYAYDGVGRVLTTSVPGHGTTTTTYTPTGRVATRTDATNGVVSFGYDVMDRLVTATDANDHVTTYGYDGRGNRTSVVDARNHLRATAYDTADRLLSTTDPLGHATTYAYDSRGRVATVADASGRSRTMTYDDAGQVTRTTFGDGSHTDLTYDGAGRVLTASDATGTETTTYDLAGNLLSDAYAGRTVGYTYDVLGRVGTITYPDGSVATNTYDGEDNLLSVSRTGGSGATYTYDADDRVQTETLPGGVTRNYGYTAGLLASYSESRTGSSISSTLGRDPAGRITSLTTGGSATAYGYDPAGQLTTVDAPGTAGDVAYVYDAAGNITGVTTGGVLTSRTYDDADRLTTSVTGGATTSHTYDAAGRLTQAASPVLTTSETYDAQGRHTATGRALPGGASTTWTRAYSPTGTLSRVDTAAVTVPLLGPPVTTTTSTALTWDAARGIPQVLAMTTAGVTSDVTYGVGKAFANTGALPAATFSHDARNNLLPTAGTAALVVPATGYTPYGRPTASAPGAAFGYREELHVGPEVHLRARTYDPSVARFTTRDPLDGTPGEPVSTNPYHYASNDPIDAEDPTGLNPAITDGDPAYRLALALAPTADWCETAQIVPTSSPHELEGTPSDVGLTCKTVDLIVKTVVVVGTVVGLDELGSGRRGQPRVWPTPKTPVRVATEDECLERYDGLRSYAPLPDDTVVVRGGEADVGDMSIRAECGDPDTLKLYGLSVNAMPGLGKYELSKFLKNKQISTTTVGAIRDVGGDVLAAPTKTNPLHALVIGITAAALNRIYTREGNPWRIG